MHVLFMLDAIKISERGSSIDITIYLIINSLNEHSNYISYWKNFPLLPFWKIIINGRKLITCLIVLIHSPACRAQTCEPKASTRCEHRLLSHWSLSINKNKICCEILRSGSNNVWTRVLRRQWCLPGSNYH